MSEKKTSSSSHKRGIFRGEESPNAHLAQAKRGKPTSLSVKHQDVSKAKIARPNGVQPCTQNETALEPLKTILPLGCWEFDMFRDKLTWSKGLFPFFGIKPSEFGGNFASFLRLVHPKDRKHVVRSCALKRSSKQGDLVCLEYRVRRPDGSIRVALDQGKVNFDKKGRARFASGVVMDITELKLLEVRYHALFEQSNDGIETITEEGRIVSTNHRLQSFLGYSEQELCTMTSSQLTHPDDVAFQEGQKARLLRGEIPSSSWDKRYICKGGRVRWAHFTLSRLLIPGSNPMLIGVVRDITDNRISDLQLASTRRALHMLSSCNEALVRGESEQSLVDEICKIAVDVGGYRMASVLYAQDDPNKTLIPASWAGYEDGYLSEISLSWSENCPEGRGAAGAVIRKGVSVIVPDISNEADYHPWSAKAMKRGYRSVVALPLTGNGRTFGVFGLYSAENRYVPEEEVALLHKLADNLAFGIMNARAKNEQERLRSAIHTIGEGISSSTGTDFYRRLLLSLTQVLGAHGAAIMEFPQDSMDEGRAVCALVDGKLLPALHYRLQGGPCESLLAHGSLVIPRDLALMFPEAPILTSLRAEAYVGRTLVDGTGTTIGWIFVVFEKPIDQVDLAVSTLKAFAMRAAGEVVRQRDDLRLREQAELLDRAQDAILVRSLDHRILFWNKGAEHLFGWTSDEILGRRVREITNVSGEVLDAALSSVMQYGEWTGELEERTKDGRLITVESRWTLLRDGSGVPTSILVIGTDVTQRKQTEENLRLLEAAVSHLNDVVLITDAQSLDEPGPRIIYVNDAFERLTGYSREEVIGRSPRFLQGPNTSRAELDRIRRALERGLPLRSEIINYTKDGRPFWIEMDIVPLADANARILHFVGVQRDITERKHAELHLLETESKAAHAQRLEAIGQLTGGIAHDFNNLLTVILGSSEMLTEATQGREDLQRLSGMIQTAGRRGAELTTKLLTFARRQALQPVTVHVGEVLQSMVPILRRTLPANIHIEVNRHDEKWSVFADPSQLESALLNLCINARDAMPNGGHLLLEASTAYLDQNYANLNPDVTPGEYVLLSVTDTGTGIAPDALNRVFEPFYTNKPRGKGTGLGLSMVYGFTKQSGGHVKIYSESGAGTSVRLYLPHASNDLLLVPSIAGEPKHVYGNETILLVEDDELVREQTKLLLEEVGYRVLPAANGVEALRVTRQGLQFDLLFSDVMMPGGMTGPQLAERIQKLRPGVPTLFCSGYAESSFLGQDWLEAGKQMLRKPYTRHQVCEKIRQLLGRDEEEERSA